jgi:anti-sigma-K factor RskA
VTEPSDRDAALAAEYALGLASGKDAREALKKASADEGFAREVARWRGRFASQLGDIEAVEPPAELWRRIDQATGAANDNVATLRRRIWTWRAATGGMTALAASLGLLLLQQPRQVTPLAPPPAVQKAGAPMVAMLGQGKEMKIVASWEPSSRQLVLAVAADMPSDPDHAHELWVIPQGGKPKSMGTMPAAKQMHMQLADALADLLQQGATIAITVEPRGGSPTGAPTGPIVASGALTKA